MTTTSKWTPSPEQREILEALRSESAREKSNADFARNYLGGISPERFSKIMAALDPSRDRSYFDEISDPESLMEELAGKLEGIRIRRGREADLEKMKFLKLSKHEKVIKAINQCLKKPGCERLIIFRAPTGGGKTMLCRRLEREFDARVADTREGWGRNYFSALRDIAIAAGVRIGEENRCNIIEDALIAHCTVSPFVLVIDEGEYFGSGALNGLKLLLNKTNITVVLCVIPEAHDRWARKYKLQSDQLDRRLHAWVEQGKVDVEDAALFFPSHQFADRSAALKMIAETASVFGHFSFINTVVEKLDGIRNADESAVKKAIEFSLRRMRKQAKAD